MKRASHWSMVGSNRVENTSTAFSRGKKRAGGTAPNREKGRRDNACAL